MDPVTVFNDVLRYVETSKLNFIMNKTPFSATISIKSTFIKRFNATQSDTDEYQGRKSVKKEDADHVVKSENSEAKDIKFRKKIQELEEEVKALTTELYHANKQKDTIEARLEEEKINLKSSEDQVCEFRADLLKVKAEKKQLKRELDNLEQIVERDTKVLNTMKLDTELASNEKLSLESKLEEVVKEVENIKEQKIVNEVNIQCEFCLFDYNLEPSRVE